MKTSVEIPTIKTLDVGCEECGAKPHQPCRTPTGKSMKGTHTARRAWRAEIMSRCKSDNKNTAKYWRWRINTGQMPNAPMPHGTYAAYKRHRAAGEEPCDHCVEQARIYFREQRRKSRAAAKAVDEEGW